MTGHVPDFQLSAYRYRKDHARWAKWIADELGNLGEHEMANHAYAIQVRLEHWAAELRANPPAPWPESRRAVAKQWLTQPEPQGWLPPGYTAEVPDGQGMESPLPERANDDG